MDSCVIFLRRLLKLLLGKSYGNTTNAAGIPDAYIRQLIKMNFKKVSCGKWCCQ